MSGPDMTFRVDWSSRSKMRGPGEGSLGELLQKLRDRLASKALGVGITYVDDRAMRRLPAGCTSLMATPPVPQ